VLRILINFVILNKNFLPIRCELWEVGTVGSTEMGSWEWVIGSRGMRRMRGEKNSKFKT
jgi:hypothetical protein